MKTTATEVDDGFILNGTKTWISGVPFCDCGIVYVMTDKAAKHKGMSAFFVDFKTLVSSRAITTKLGLFLRPNRRDFLRRGKDSQERPRRQARSGIRHLHDHAQLYPTQSAAWATGVAQSCIEEACKYANERKAVRSANRTVPDGPGTDRKNVG